MMYARALEATYAKQRAREEVGLAEAGGEADVQTYADYKIHSVAELRQAAPELFN